MTDHIKFNSDNNKMLWLEEQMRIMWEFLEKEGLDEEADHYIKEQLIDGYER
jgi:hypothetical protein